MCYVDIRQVEKADQSEITVVLMSEHDYAKHLTGHIDISTSVQYSATWPTMMKNSVKYTDRQKLTNQNKSRRYSNTNTPLKGLIHPKNENSVIV